jgi:hypothetical protein
MANIKINWTNSADVTGVTGVRVFKKSDSGGSALACDAFTGANALPTDALPTGVTQCNSGYDTTPPTAGSTGEYIDQGVTTGEWYYAVFYYNGAGYSPCSAMATAVSIP